MKKIVLVFLYISVGLSLFAQTEREVAAASQPQKPVYTAEQQRLRITAKDIRLVPETKLETKGYRNTKLECRRCGEVIFENSLTLLA